MADPVAADEPRPNGKPRRRFPCSECPEWFWSRADVARHYHGIHEAEARSLSDSEPPPADLMERAYIHLHLCKDDHEGDADLHDSIRLWLSGQPQPALSVERSDPSEPPDPPEVRLLNTTFREDAHYSFKFNHEHKDGTRHAHDVTDLCSELRVLPPLVAEPEGATHPPPSVTLKRPPSVKAR